MLTEHWLFFLSRWAQINFVTSFTGKDTLYTRIQANNIPDTNDAGLAFAGDDDTNAYGGSNKLSSILTINIGK